VIHLPRNNPRLGAHIRQHYPVEEVGIFHDYNNIHQLRTFGDPDVAVVAALDVGGPFRPPPVPGGLEGQGRYTRNHPNQDDRHARTPADMVSRLPLLRRGLASTMSAHTLSHRSLASANTETKRQGSKMALYCHAHLVDRHYLRRPAVFDADGVMNASPISLAADFFHPSASDSGSGCTDGVYFGHDARDISFRRMGGMNPGGPDVADGITRPQTTLPQRLPIPTIDTEILDEETHLPQPSPPSTEHSGETLFLTPSSSPTAATERDGSITPPPPPGQFVDYTTAAPATTGLTPPPLRHSNYMPPQSLPSPTLLLDVPVLEGSPYHVRSQPLPPTYDDVVTMSSGGTGAFSRATFPYVVELNVMNDVALDSYSSTFGPHQVEESQQQHLGGGVKELPQQQGVANRLSGGSALWKKRVKDRIRHYEAKLKSHLDKTSKLSHSLSSTNNSNGNHPYNKSAYYADHGAFNECILDFWDEFFTLTANIHYFDMHSPIPRVTRMWEFLSQPCPKALGTIQCEIERMRTVKNPNGKKKRRGIGGVKERLFPTYEYRLFVRDRNCEHQQQQQQQYGQGAMRGQDNRNNQQHPHAPLEVDGGGHGGNLDENGEINQPPPTVRLDTVLMTARYKGKEHEQSVSSSGGAGASSSKSKKGVNNYYLHMPQKQDIERHFKTVNEQSVALKDYEQLAQKVPPSTAKELGRVQSNFIGTEFQIFSPKNVNKCSRCSSKINTSSVGGTGASNSPCGVCDGTAEPDSGTNAVSGGYNRQMPDNTTIGNRSENGAQQIRGLRRLRSSKLRRRRKNGSTNPRQEDGESNQTQQTIDNGETAPAGPLISRFKNSWLRSRRVIANSTTEHSDSAASQILVSPEVEIGAITYTANLLGNRPRIMDVCIPKVHSNEWRNYCENSDGSFREDTGPCGTMEEERSMLSKLKLLQLVAEQELLRGTLDLPIENPAEIAALPQDFGLLSLQNRPPWWNIELGAFVLNFGGRVSVASVKNFQLCDRHNHDDSMLQFGRIEGRHSFTMDYSHPLSAVQAFAIAISSLQSKISFG